MYRSIRKLSFLFVFLFTVYALTGCSNSNKVAEIQPLNFDKFWDKVFVQPIAWMMNLLTDYTGYYAIGIILTTIVVRTILFPIYTKTNDTSAKMQSVQPQLKKIQEKYAGKTDPESKQKQQMELMQVYKDNNINVLAGCLMPFLQMPVFIAMYNAVVKSPITPKYGYLPEQLNFLWLDLNKPDPYYVLPILVALTAVALQFISMYGLSPEAKNNPTMKMMTWMMPAMMLMFSLPQAAALSLYWIAGNVYSTLQTLFVKKPFKKKQ